MKNILIFLAGAGVGASAAWYFTKKRYRKYADDEIKDVVEKFTDYKHKLEEMSEDNLVDERNVNPSNNNERSEQIITDNTTTEDTISRDSEELSNGLIDNPRGDESVIKPYENESTMPYVISDEEFGDNEDYDQRTLFWYYKDNILATDEDLEIEDKRTTIGDALEEFKKDRYVERVFVRNEQDETDYEILISEKHFYEVSGGDIE